MLDIKYIRENAAEVKKATAAKQMDPSLVDKVLELDEKRRNLLVEVENLRSQKNKIANEIKMSGGKPSADKVSEGKKVKEKLKKLEPKLTKAEEKYLKASHKIPNVIAGDVPYGKDEGGNKVLRKWGKPKKFDFKPLDHVEIGKLLDIIDVETSAKVSGSRFYYLKNEAVMLQFALIQFVFETLTDKKVIAKIAKKTNNPSGKLFTPILPPVFINKDVAVKMDRFYPDESYYFERDDKVLVGSAEHSLGPMHMDQVFNEKDLPLRYLGYSTAFRRESGAYGKDLGGIFRVHQFDKAEMETFVKPEDGEVEQDFIVAIQEYLVQQLEIPYQVIYICSGDMGKPDYRQYDINCWMPGQGKFRETHTSDYMTDYQSRRLNTKVRIKGKSEFVYMNDATAIAMSRTPVAILENYQQKDGSVKVPKVLQKWVGKERLSL